MNTRNSTSRGGLWAGDKLATYATVGTTAITPQGDITRRTRDGWDNETPHGRKTYTIKHWAMRQ